ncbi:MAG: glycosyl transferase, partial [Candidatus Eisenbacteria bacterium]
QDGRGESVWMAFFLHAAITAWAPHAERRTDTARLALWREHQRSLEQALETSGWDGGWYRRGYYGDGTPLGSAGSDECRIDALAQAWAVISGAVPRERAETAMRSAEQHLVSTDDRLVRLLTPPFEHTPKDPGYIKGYVPGVRENGGQYTHAALWVVRAMAELGWRDRAASTLAMLSPVSHAGDPAGVARYQVEPYVIAADVYGAPPHVGRGGWTWYTGSAGWMYRVAVESVFGLSVENGDRLRITPCLPDEWPEAQVEWRVPGSETLIRVRYRNPSGCAAAVRSATLDGAPMDVTDGRLVVPLPRDGATHHLEVLMGQTGARLEDVPSA